MRLFLLTGLLITLGLASGPRKCHWDPGSARLSCASIRINSTVRDPSHNLTTVLLNGFTGLSSKIREIEIGPSWIRVLRFEELGPAWFPGLRSLSLRNCSILNLTGVIPNGLRSLDLSYNLLERLNFTTFSSNRSELGVLDLSHNRLLSLPNNTFHLNLTSLNLMGNHFRCNWVMGPSFSKWYSRGENTLQNLNDTFCMADQEVFGNMSFRSAIEIRTVGTKECNKVDCECDLRTTIGNGKFPSRNYPYVNATPYGKVSFTLRADCSGRNLTRLPPISKFTVFLSVDRNEISDLSRLNTDPNYVNLHSLNINHNEVQNLDYLVNSPFFDRVQVLQLQNNHISQIPEQVITAMFTKNNNALRINNIGLGNNVINCDCSTFTRLKPKLIAHESIIKDWKSITCRSPNVTLLDLRYDQVCYIAAEESELKWYIIIGLEVSLILLVLGKLWRDKVEYKRTGRLPTCSTWIPRLPCDFMLESLKDNRPSSHHNSTSKV